MSIEAVLDTRRGLVVAPAGCGKTHLITEVLRIARNKPYLVLTHTTAGVTALKKRLNRLSVPPQNYVVTTIDGWALRIAGCFPGLCPIDVGPEVPSRFYPSLRRSVLALLRSGNINAAIRASYCRLLVDEYQDCNVMQHEMTVELSRLMPTVVFGDPMQCIFNFSGPMPHWTDTVQTSFPLLTTLDIPWRWNNANAHALGEWILDTREKLLNTEPVDLASCPEFVRFNPLTADLNAILTLQQQEYYGLLQQYPDDSLLVIGDSRSADSRHQFAQRINGIDVVEPVDLSNVMGMARALDGENTGPGMLARLLRIASEMMTNMKVDETLRCVSDIMANGDSSETSPLENALVMLTREPSRQNLRAAIPHLEKKRGTRVFRNGACQVLKDALSLSIRSSDISIYEAAAIIREQRRYQGDRRITHRAIGSTLLLKGLECDHALILDAGSMSASNLYVALSRGAKSIVLFSENSEFRPEIGNR
ncbi:UvrD-helicase domain-containing protein [Leclercia adecarboxylata]|uniref:UvrD-helicase domain-containing protein n=1 Tax=Leclercia adecarboxylata TaxID=83655 RepID=UPI0038517117